MFPEPKAATAVQRANIYASGLKPFFIPSSMKYMGPPRTLPSVSILRYMIARVHSVYLIAIPKKAETHIQKIAPGPP